MVAVHPAASVVDGVALFGLNNGVECICGWQSSLSSFVATAGGSHFFKSIEDAIHKHIFMREDDLQISKECSVSIVHAPIDDIVFIRLHLPLSVGPFVRYVRSMGFDVMRGVNRFVVH